MPKQQRYRERDATKRLSIRNGVANCFRDVEGDVGRLGEGGWSPRQGAGLANRHGWRVRGHPQSAGGQKEGDLAGATFSFTMQCPESHLVAPEAVVER